MAKTGPVMLSEARHASALLGTPLPLLRVPERAPWVGGHAATRLKLGRMGDRKGRPYPGTGNNHVKLDFFEGTRATARVAPTQVRGTTMLNSTSLNAVNNSRFSQRFVKPL